MGPIQGDTAAHVDYDDEWPPYNVTVRVDPKNDQSVVQYVLHELIHVVFSPFIDRYVGKDLEEVLVVALDGHMYDYVRSSKSRLAAWNKLIDEKLASTKDESGT